MSNIYFKNALQKASKILGNRSRLLTLVTQVLSKLKYSHFSGERFTDRFFLMGRLLKAYALGSYRHISIQSMLLLTAAAVYFINPFDLIPDAIIGLGLTDDITILTSVYKLVSKELTKFRQWEISQSAFSE